MPTALALARAGRWFLESGIQEPSGGVARYYRSELGRNKPVSTEITGYTASALVYLFRTTGNDEYLDRARKTADFLMTHAWAAELQTFPFEHPSPCPVSPHAAYFFDCGIIIRGLLAVWNQTGEDRILDVALDASRAMVADFHAGPDYHPILDLPSKQAQPRTDHWSRSPGCYQLKSALAWYDVAEKTGDAALRHAYIEMLETALTTYSSFLPAATPHQTMDRLHAAGYFLEALTPVLDRPDCAAAFTSLLLNAVDYLHEIAPTFARSDVYAQLLRARINGASVVPVDHDAAVLEAAALRHFQISSDDPRVDGGFSFGRREGEMSPHINPVSTAFALQALEMWREQQAGNPPPCRHLLI